MDCIYSRAKVRELIMLSGEKVGYLGKKNVKYG